MTESDYRWLANDNLPGQVIKVADGSQWHYAQGGWHETDPVPEQTAADIEAQAVEENDALEPANSSPLDDSDDDTISLADNEQEPDPQPPAEEES